MSSKMLCMTAGLISALLLMVTAANTARYCIYEPACGKVISVSSSRSGRYLDIVCKDGQTLEIKVSSLYSAEIGSNISLRISPKTGRYMLPYELSSCYICTLPVCSGLMLLIQRKRTENFLQKSP